MASKGLRAISYHGTRKLEAEYKPSQTTETLIGYTACCAFVLYFHFQFFFLSVLACSSFAFFL
jgi:hypothetical protein